MIDGEKMSERNYYVICDDNCKFPAMTAEQVLQAIAAATGATGTPINEAFITQIREQNKSDNLKFWRGTTAEYNAITQKDANTFYILTDDTRYTDINTLVEEVEEQITALTEAVGDKADKVETATANNFASFDAAGNIKDSGKKASDFATLKTGTAVLTYESWNSDNTYTVNVSGVTATNTVIVAPDPASYSDYVAAGIYCSTQGNGTLTFKRTTETQTQITVNVVILN